MQQPVASRIINVYDVALRHIVQPLLLADMLLSVTGLSDFLFLVVLVPIPLRVVLLSLIAVCVGFKDYFLFS